MNAARCETAGILLGSLLFIVVVAGVGLLWTMQISEWLHLWSVLR